MPEMHEDMQKQSSFISSLDFVSSITPSAGPQWGTADAEIKYPPGGSQGLSKVPSV